MSEKALNTDSISELRSEIDHCDEIIREAVKRRTKISQQIGRIRAAEGGPRIVPARESQIREKYSELGPEGNELADILLRLGRGPADKS